MHSMHFHTVKPCLHTKPGCLTIGFTTSRISPSVSGPMYNILEANVSPAHYGLTRSQPLLHNPDPRSLITLNQHKNHPNQIPASSTTHNVPPSCTPRSPPQNHRTYTSNLLLTAAYSSYRKYLLSLIKPLFPPTLLRSTNHVRDQLQPT